MDKPLGSLGHVILPVADIGAAVELIENALGLPLRFRDGDRYAAFDAGGATLALAAAEEQVVEGRVAIALRVSDISAARARLLEAGACDVGDVLERDHEWRVTFADGDGNPFVAYQSKPAG